MSSYEEAIEFLYNSLPVYQHIGVGAYKPGLNTSLSLAALFGNPERAYPCIHIAGTNGKGSTAHSLASILQCSGLRVGLYTSPHIFDFRERIRVNGEMISREAVTDFVEGWRRISLQHHSMTPSFFELTSTLAFEYFRDKEIDIAVIETGLGGRLDSTNIITPILSVITNISLDHTALLGDTLPRIAGEKAGIIKPGVPVVIGERNTLTDPVFIERARECDSPVIFATPVEGQVSLTGNFYPVTPFGPIAGELSGLYQIRNAATIFASVLALRDLGWNIPDRAVADGMACVTELTHLYGRWSKIGDQPLTIADTGHNCGGWAHIVQQVASVEAPAKALVIGFVADKNLTPILEGISTLGSGIKLYFSTPSVPRGLPASSLAAQAASVGLDGTVIDDVNSAVEAARNSVGPEGFVLVAGSNFLIADLRH